MTIAVRSQDDLTTTIAGRSGRPGQTPEIECQRSNSKCQRANAKRRTPEGKRERGNANEQCRETKKRRANAREQTPSKECQRTNARGQTTEAECQMQRPESVRRRVNAKRVFPGKCLSLRQWRSRLDRADPAFKTVLSDTALGSNVDREPAGRVARSDPAFKPDPDRTSLVADQEKEPAGQTNGGAARRHTHLTLTMVVSRLRCATMVVLQLHCTRTTLKML